MSKKQIFISGVVLLFLLLAFWNYGANQQSQDPKQNVGIFTSNALGIRLEVPLDWQPDLRYPVIGGEPTGLGGPNGFVYFDLLSSDKEITPEEVALNLKNSPGSAYGSMPVIEKSKREDVEIAYLWPGDDQPQSKQDEAAAIVAYPKPIELNGAMYQILVILADKAHLESIAESLSFKEGSGE